MELDSGIRVGVTALGIKGCGLKVVAGGCRVDGVRCTNGYTLSHTCGHSLVLDSQPPCQSVNLKSLFVMVNNKLTI